MNTRRCPNPDCPEIGIDVALVACTRCGRSFRDSEIALADQLRGLLDSEHALAASLEERTWRRLKRKVNNYSLAGAVAVGVLGVLGIEISTYQAEQRIAKLIEDQLVVRFGEPRIRETLEDVAKREASDLIDGQIAPVVLASKAEIEEKLKSLDVFIDKFRAEYAGQLSQLKSELTTIQDFNAVQRLRNDAFNGSALALQELEHSTAGDADLMIAVVAAINDVKAHYVGTSRIRGIELVGAADDGRAAKNEGISTGALLALLRDTNWQIRAKSAELLGERKDTRLPGALLALANADSHLEVRRTALRSFCLTSGYDSPDVFGWDRAAEWFANPTNEKAAIQRMTPARN